MPITLQEVIKRLGADEPDYAALAAMGPEAVPHLAALINGEDQGLASKAAYLASVIQTDEAIEVLKLAAASTHDIVRVAAAAGLRNLSAHQAASLTDQLLDDKDAGVRKLAVRAAGRLGLSAVEPKVEAIAMRDEVKLLRAIAAVALEKIWATRAVSEQ